MRFVQSIMRDGFSLGRAFGIPISANPSLIPIALVLIVGIASGLEFGLFWNLVLGVLMVGIVFGSILLHELGHSLTARAYGIDTRSIILHLFGGVAQIVREPRRPAEEFFIAIAGPAVSLALALIFGCLAFAVAFFAPPTLLWEGVITPLLGGMTANLVLGIFNLLPGFPMDGGRVLRAWLWHRSGNLPLATVRAATGGQIVGYLLIGIGLVRLLGFGDIGGIFMVLIATFITSLAGLEKRRAAAMTWMADGAQPTQGRSWSSAAEPSVRVVEYTVRYPDGREVSFTRRG
ncbi:MAG: site-2 protease family protein [Planctomycetota bacterium]